MPLAVRIHLMASKVSLIGFVMEVVVLVFGKGHCELVTSDIVQK